MNFSLFSSRVLSLVLVSTLFGLPGCLVPLSRAATLTHRDLQAFGFKGTYRGFATGRITVWQDKKYRNIDFDDNATMRFPVGKRTLVAGPTSGNRFTLNYRAATGNSRRVQVIGTYSGVTYNPRYRENMYGTGRKVITIVKRGSASPRFRMTITDNLNERAVRDRALFGKWSVQGTLYK